MVFWIVVISDSKFSPTLNDLTDISGIMNASPSCENLLQTSAMPKYPAESSKNDLSCPITASPLMKRAPSSVRKVSGKKNCRTFQGQNGVFKEISAEHGTDFVNK